MTLNWNAKLNKLYSAMDLKAFHFSENFQYMVEVMGHKDAELNSIQ